MTVSKLHNAAKLGKSGPDRNKYDTENRSQGRDTHGFNAGKRSPSILTPISAPPSGGAFKGREGTTYLNQNLYLSSCLRLKGHPYSQENFPIF